MRRAGYTTLRGDPNKKWDIMDRWGLLEDISGMFFDAIAHVSGANCELGTWEVIVPGDPT